MAYALMTQPIAGYSCLMSYALCLASKHHWLAADTGKDDGAGGWPAQFEPLAQRGGVNTQPALLTPAEPDPPFAPAGVPIIAAALPALLGLRK